MAKLSSAQRKKVTALGHGLYDWKARKIGSRKQRRAAWDAAISVYEPGMSQYELQTEIVNKCRASSGGVGAFDWLAFIERLLPIIMAILKMFM